MVRMWSLRALVYGWVLVMVSVGLEEQRHKGGSLHVPDHHPGGPPLRVHIVPHSHCDSGWLKTYLEYYWGERQDIQVAGVETILNSVVEALLVDPSRRFVFAEMSFFAVWFRQQSDRKKEVVRRLVSNGQLEFVNGGWVQHDEAGSHYVAMIDQTTRGHQFLKREFGYVPRIGWQIDPFGHSGAQAGLMGKDIGFDALFFGRADWEDMAIRKKKKQLEFLWKGSGGGPMSCDVEDRGLFTGNFASGNYVPPVSFNFEFGISDTPIQDDPLLRGYNVEERVSEFVDRCHELAAMTRGDDIIFTMGSDFHYAAAEAWFTNLDKLIKAVNARFAVDDGGEDGSGRRAHRKIQVFYSSPSEYVRAKAKQAAASNVSYPVKVDDFFPYSDAREAFWTGYFTSRATSKRYIRMATSFLQAARQLEVYHRGTGKFCARGTDPLEEAVALTQHHDSITGTERQAVADDYHVWLSEGMHAAQAVVSEALATWYVGEDDMETGRHHVNFVFCPLNESRCEFTEKRDSFTVTAYNPTSFQRDIPISVPVSTARSATWRVLGPEGQRIDADTVVFDEGKDGRKHRANVKFLAAVAPLGSSSYLISSIDVDVDIDEQPPGRLGQDGTRQISNGQITLSFASSGMAETITFEDDNVSMPFSIDMLWYNSSDGRDSDINRGQSSGAYIFRPNGRKHPLATTNITLDIVHGDVVSEARQTFNPWGSLVTRLFKGKPYVEVEWEAGPLPLDDIGREVVIVYKVAPALSELWTDANGRAMIRRLRNGRFSWDSQYADAIAANYYPITAAAVLQDPRADAPGASLTVLTDRAQGAASLEEGELEIMLHRRTIVDDGRGVEEPLDEKLCADDRCHGIVARGRHHILLEHKTSPKSATMRRMLQQELNDDPVVVFSRAAVYENAKIRSKSMMSERAKTAFSFPLHVLTIKEELKSASERTLTIRIAHQMDDVNTLDGGRPRRIDVTDLMDLVRGVGCSDIRSATEVSLSTNQAIDEMKSRERPQFELTSEVIGDVACEQVYFDHRRQTGDVEETEPAGDDHGRDDTHGDVLFEPMSIRTWHVVCAL